MKTKDTLLCEDLLQKHGYRLTLGRIALLVFLKNRNTPLSASNIQKELQPSLDKVTLYRALEDFSKSKIIAKVNLQNATTYYEFIHADYHHHHLICEQCGKLEDIENCNQINLQKEILKHSKNFKVVHSHSLEFFGVCKECGN